MEALIDRLRAALAEAGSSGRCSATPRRWRISACSIHPPRSGRSRIRSSPRPRCSSSMPTTRRCWSRASTPRTPRAAPCPSSSTARTTTSGRPHPRSSWRRRSRGLAGGPGQIGVEASSLPVAVADVLRAEGAELVRGRRARRALAPHQAPGRARRDPARLAALRSSCRAPSRSSREPGVSEAEVAALAQAVMASEAGAACPRSSRSRRARRRRRAAGRRPSA